MAQRLLHRLTPKFVETALRGNGPDGRFADGGHVYLVVKGLAASWAFVVTRNGKQKQYAIGSAHRFGDLAVSSDMHKRAVASLAEARRRGAEMRANLFMDKPLKNEASADNKVKWANILNYYVDVKSIDKAKVAKYVTQWETILNNTKSAYGNRDLAIDYRDTLLASIKPSTVKNYIKMLSAMYELYITDKQVEIKNPFAKLNVEIRETEIEKRDSMSIDVINKVWHKLDGDDKLIWDLLTVTGARIGEIVGLKSADIVNGFIRIEGNDKRSIKTESSRRVIPSVIDVPKRDTEYYFADSVNAVTWRFASKIREVTNDKKIVTHSLRHAATDALREGGVDSTLEGFALGHSAKSVAGKTYGSLDSRAKVLKERVEPVMKAYYDKIKAGR